MDIHYARLRAACRPRAGVYRRISCQLDAHSSLIAAALAVLLIATAPEEFGVPECTTTLEAAGLCGPHRWGYHSP